MAEDNLIPPGDTAGLEPGQVLPTTPAAPDPPASPPLQDVSIGGQTYQVSPDVAALVHTQQQQLATVQEQNTRLTQRLGEFDTWRQQMGQAITGHTGPAQPIDYTTLLYTDPTTAFSRFKEEVVGELRTMYQNDQQERASQDALQRFMDNFYTTHHDLRNLRPLVQTTLQAHAQEWSQLPTHEIDRRLAEATRAQALQIAQQFGAGGGGPNLRLVEGGGEVPGSPGGPHTAGDEVVDGNSVPLGTLGADIKAMRAKRKAR